MTATHPSVSDSRSGFSRRSVGPPLSQHYLQFGIPPWASDPSVGRGCRGWEASAQGVFVLTQLWTMVAFAYLVYPKWDLVAFCHRSGSDRVLDEVLCNSATWDEVQKNNKTKAFVFMLVYKRVAWHLDHSHFHPQNVKFHRSKFSFLRIPPTTSFLCLKKKKKLWRKQEAAAASCLEKPKKKFKVEKNKTGSDSLPRWSRLAGCCSSGSFRTTWCFDGEGWAKSVDAGFFCRWESCRLTLRELRRTAIHSSCKTQRGSSGTDKSPNPCNTKDQAGSATFNTKWDFC